MAETQTLREAVALEAVRFEAETLFVCLFRGSSPGTHRPEAPASAVITLSRGAPADA